MFGIANSAIVTRHPGYYTPPDRWNIARPDRGRGRSSHAARDGRRQDVINRHGTRRTQGSLNPNLNRICFLNGARRDDVQASLASTFNWRTVEVAAGGGRRRGASARHLSQRLMMCDMHGNASTSVWHILLRLRLPLPLPFTFTFTFTFTSPLPLAHRSFAHLQNWNGPDAAPAGSIVISTAPTPKSTCKIILERRLARGANTHVEKDSVLYNSLFGMTRWTFE